MLRFRPSYQFFLFLLILGSTFSLLAQDFRPSQNFDLYQNKESSSSVEQTADGNLTLDEYERRKAQYLKLNSEQLGVDQRILQRQLQDLSERSRLEREIEQAKENQKTWQELNSDNVVELANSPDKTENQKLDKLEAQLLNADEFIGVSQEQIELLKKLQEQLSSGDVSPESLLESINKLTGTQDLPIPPQYKGTVAEQVYRNSAALQAMDSQQLEEQLKSQLSDGPAAGIASLAPSLIPNVAKILQDPQALPDAALIVDNRAKLVRFVLLNLALFVLSFVGKRKIRKMKLSQFKKSFFQSVRWLSFMSLRIIVLLVFYGENLAPMWKILTS